MNDIYHTLAQLHPLIPVLIFAGILMLGMMFSWTPWQQLIRHWRLSRMLNRLGAALCNVYLPDGLGDVIYVERLVLRGNGLLLVTVKPFRGNIFAAAQIDRWTQVSGHHSYKFPNPLHQQEADLQVLRGLSNKSPVNGLVVFTQGSTFPKGKPTGVCDYDELRILSNSDSEQPISSELQQVWQSLVEKAETASAVQQTILQQSRDRRDLWLGLICLLGAILFAVWFWLMPMFNQHLQ